MDFVEPVDFVMSLPEVGTVLEFGAFSLTGIVGFSLDPITGFGTPYEGELQRFAVYIRTVELRAQQVSEGMTFSFSYPPNIYRFQVEKFLDLIDGWTKVSIDFIEKLGP
jgi:hypothetical protein